MPEDYEPPSNTGGRPRKLQPAMADARANPGRWVIVTELSTSSSAASRASGMRKNAKHLGFEIGRDDRKVLIKFVGEPETEGQPADAEPHWPDGAAAELTQGEADDASEVPTDVLGDASSQPPQLGLPQ